MIKIGTRFFISLVLMLAAACSAVETAEQTAANIEPEEVTAQGAAASTLEAGSEPVDATPAPLDTAEPVVPVETVTAEPEETAVVSAPVDTVEPPNDDDAAKIYAAAIRQMYSVDYSFAEPGEPLEFPLVYIVSTTDDGTGLFNPATPPQKLTPELRQAIEAELADLLFEIIWIESLDEAPVDNRNGKIADGEGIVITMGNILPQEDGTVYLPFYMLCGSLCLSGKTYVLVEAENAWQVTGSVGAVVEG